MRGAGPRRLLRAVGFERIEAVAEFLDLDGLVVVGGFQVCGHDGQVIPNPTSTDTIAFGSTVTFRRDNGRV